MNDSMLLQNLTKSLHGGHAHVTPEQILLGAMENEVSELGRENGAGRIFFDQTMI